MPPQPHQLLCTAVAILLHYFFLGTFAWLLVQGLHLYRMQVEPATWTAALMRLPRPGLSACRAAG